MFDRYFDRLENWYQDHREQVDFVLVWLLRMVVLVGAYAVFIICTTSCKSQQVIYQTSGRDSIIVHNRYDTTFITITDTLHITLQQSEKKDESAVIDFVEGGGSMNLLTGQIDGVATIKTKRESSTDMQATAEWQSRVERLQATSDSLRQVLKTYKIASERKTNTADIKPARSSYDRFCSAFFWIVAIAGVLALAVWLTNKRYGWWTVLKALMRI